MLLVGGLALLLGGTPVMRAFSGPPEGRQQHLIVWTVFAMAIVAGGLGFWWMQTELSALGADPTPLASPGAEAQDRPLRVA